MLTIESVSSVRRSLHIENSRVDAKDLLVHIREDNSSDGRVVRMDKAGQIALRDYLLARHPLTVAEPEFNSRRATRQDIQNGVTCFRIEANCGGRIYFAGGRIGDVLILVRDDKSEIPWFRFEDPVKQARLVHGYGCYALEDLSPLYGVAPETKQSDLTSLRAIHEALGKIIGS